MAIIPRKPDSEDIKSFLRELASQDWIRRSDRANWPRYVFHFTDVRNAVRILETGKLLSRNRAEQLGLVSVDSASPEIIEHTQEKVKTYVRLYFRPRTPTQYRNEGIRTREQLQLGGAHCPVPIFFLFDSEDILTRQDSEFTEGSLAHRLTPPTRGRTAAFLKRLPFKKIYHVGGYPREQTQEMNFHRQAEVIIPDELDLSALKWLYCRSPAEKETFLALMPPPLRKKYQRRVVVAGRTSLYERKWTFVERVIRKHTDRSHMLSVFFSPDSRTPGPFHARFLIQRIDDFIPLPFIKEIPDFDVRQYNPLDFDLPLELSHYRFRVEMDDQLAYENEFKSIPDLPQ